MRAQQLVLRFRGNEWLEVVNGVEQLSRLLGYQPAEGKVHIVESLYLVYSGAATVVGEDGSILGFRELIERYTRINPYAWVEFEVYYDLRRRGRLLVPGPRPHSFLVRKSKREPVFTKYILVLEESRPLELSMLVSFVEEALHNRWEPILAIVDRYGDITYYSVTLFRPRRLAGIQEAGVVAEGSR